MIYFILRYTEMPAEDRCEKALRWVMNVIMYVGSEIKKKEDMLWMGLIFKKINIKEH